MSNFYFSFLSRLGLFSRNYSCASSPYIGRKSTTTNFGFALLLVSFLLNTSHSFAQNITSYAFATGNDGSLEDISVGNTSYLTGVQDDTAGTVQPLGIDFIFMGIKYTHFSANSNGQMRLHASGTESAIGSSVTTGSNQAILAPFTGDNEVGNGMRFKVIGTAPNRTFVLEWNQFYVNYVNLSNAGNMQVWLQENTGKITYIYGEIYNAATSSQSRSISIASSNTATTVGSITIGNPSTFTVGSTLVSNTIAAGTNPVGSPLIANIGSAVNGSRTYFTFTPPSAVSGDVTNLAFSAVLANGVTLNWEDNATSELGFIITRATNAEFTQNVASFAVASTTSATTGTPYSLVQTNLAAGTTFYYKVTANAEGVQSLGIAGNVATTAGATYYWTGATGGNWNTFANWNTAADGTGSTPAAWDNSDIYVIDGEGTTAGGLLSIIVDRTSFTAGQVKIVSNTELTLASSATTTRTITILGGAGDDFVLESGSSLNLTSATNAVAFAFSGSGNNGIIAGSYSASGSTSNVINTTGGTGTSVVVESTGSVTSSLNSSSAALVGSIATLRFENGSNYNHAASTTVNYIPTATWLPNATATLNGNTTGTGMTSNSTSLGNLIINTTLSTATFSAFTSSSRIIQGNLTINSTGTGKFRAVTSGLLQINGNLVINGGTFEVGSTTGGGVIVKGNTTVASGAILDLNQSVLQNEGNLVNNGSILSSETTTTNSSLNFLSTVAAQTLSGTGNFTGRVSSLGVSNPLGLTISTPVLTQRVNLFSGTITGSSNITIGTGLALAGVVQIGSASNTTSGGTFDAAPVFNLGTGTFSLLYLGETTSRTTGFEVPASRSVNNLTVNNANGLTISGGTIEVINALTLTNGIVTSTFANHIIHGTATAAGTLTGGSATSFISGPIVRAIANANTAFILFPVGKGQYAPVSLAPTTTEVTLMRAEAFDSNAGTSNASIINLSANRRWETALVSGAFNDIKVRVADALIVNTNIPVQAPSAAGVYTSTFGSTSTFTAGTPNVVEGFAAVPAANFTGFLSFADSNACSGTPAPGNTIASANGICFGSSVNLSLQTLPIGSGITYQWKSSTDGVTYTDILGATNPTLTVTPMVATYYLAEVTCSAGPVTGSSTAIQITFGNNVVTTTPAARCGLGTVSLGATASEGATLTWYDAASGGNQVGTGSTFVTPTLENTTNFYVEAQTNVTGSATIGSAVTLTGATSQPTAFCNRWPNYWSQTIYTAAELTAAGLKAGNINSMAYNIATLGDAATNANFTVKIGTTAGATFANTTFIPTTSFTNVYGPSTYTHTASGWQVITFTTPYVWDGVSNIIINVTHDGADSTNNSQTFYTATAGSTTLWVNSYTGSTTTGTTSPNRLNIMFGGQVACSSPRVAVTATVTSPPALTLNTENTVICSGTSSSAITLSSNPANYDTYIWSPAAGVTGDSVSGWIFNPTVTTTYTLTATQSAGDLCGNTTTLTVVVNQLPSPLLFTSAPSPTCINTPVALTVSGGSSDNISIFNENFNGVTNSFTTLNNTSGAADNTIPAWTLRPSGFVQTSTTFVNSDASQFYLSNSDAAGTGNITDVSLISPSFSTMNFTSANLTFNHFYRHWASGSGIGSVAYSLDNGTTWINIQTYTATVGAANLFAAANLTLPAAALNKPSVLLRFRHSVTWGYYWAIDNVALSGTKVNDITWSPVTNLFTDAAGTIAYTEGTPTSTVYFKPTATGSTTFTATATTTATCSISASTTIEAVDCSIPYANLQFPGVSTIGTCVSPTYYARVYKAGVTEAAGQGAGIQAWIGKHTADTDPATWPETSWQLATFNVQSGNDDEYQATFAPSAAGTYYVASRFVFAPGTFVYGGYTPSGGGIWNGNSTVSGVLTVEDTPAPTASAQTFCNSGTVADLVATGTALQWYAASTGGTALEATTGLASGDYYVSQTLNSCEGPRTMVAVTVNVTAAPTASAQTFCNSATVADLVATGTALQWYAASTGGTALAGSTALASGDYYVSQTLNSCEGPRTMVTVTVNVTAAPTASAQTFCNTATVADLMATGTALQWYADSTGGTALASTTALASGNYYVSQTLNACEGPRTMVAVTVNAEVVPTFTQANPICSGETLVALPTVSNNGITGSWSPALNNLATTVYTFTPSPGQCASVAIMTIAVSPNVAPSFNAVGPICSGGTLAPLPTTSDNGITGTWSPALNNTVTTTYTFTPNTGQCAMTTTITIVVNVTAAPTGAATQDFITGQTLANFTVVGQNIIWYSSATGSTILPATTVLVSGTIYYASQTVNGCESVTRLAVTAGVDLKTPGFEIRNLRYYPNPVQDILTVDYSDTIEKVQMYNMLGQMVYNRNTNASKVTVEMTNMAAGNYILQVTVNGITKNVKVIKK